MVDVVNSVSPWRHLPQSGPGHYYADHFSHARTARQRKKKSVTIAIVKLVFRIFPPEAARTVTIFLGIYQLHLIFFFYLYAATVSLHTTGLRQSTLIIGNNLWLFTGVGGFHVYWVKDLAALCGSGNPYFLWLTEVQSCSVNVTRWTSLTDEQVTDLSGTEPHQ